MSPLAHTLFTLAQPLQGGALSFDPAGRAPLDSLDRVERALCGVVTGKGGLAPARDRDTIRQELNSLRRCIGSLASDILAEQRAGNGNLAREMEWQLSVWQTKATALALELTPSLFD